MARIRIEDLPAVDNLTAEEQEQILGAGLRSFKPTFEALEAREVYDVGLNQAWLTNAAPPPAAPSHQAPMVRELAPQIQVDMSLPSSTLARSDVPLGHTAPMGAAGQSATTSTWEDVNFIQGKAEQIVREKVINAKSPWSINPFLRVTGSTVGTVTNKQIEITVTVRFRLPGNGLGNTGGEADGTFTLSFVKTRQNDMKVYTLANPSHHNFDKAPLIDQGALNNKLANLCKSEVIPMNQRWDSSKGEYDGGQLARRISDWALKALTAEKNGEPIQANVHSITHHPDGLKVEVLINRRRGGNEPGSLERIVTFDLTYAGQVNGKDQFTVRVTSAATQGDWTNGRSGLGYFNVTEDGLKKELSALVNS